MTQRAIEVEHLVREFKKGPRAVDGINLHVDPGEIYGFLGPNGAGKTTTVSMLITLLRPSGGRALVGGFDVATQGAEVRRTIGAALQEAALDPLLDAREHLLLQAGLHGFPSARASARAEELLHRVGLTVAAERKVGTFSGGMKRRLDLALALVHHPRIIFLDEPTTGLDIQSRTALWEEVGSLAKNEGVTIFLTTQYLEEADVLADRVGIIDRGRIVAEGTPAELKAEIGRATVEVIPERREDRSRVAAILERFGEPTTGTPNAVTVRLYHDAAVVAEIVRAMDAERVAVSDLQLHAPTLDDVFLAKTGRSLEGAGQGAEPEPEPEQQTWNQQPAYQAGWQQWPIYPTWQPAAHPTWEQQPTYAQPAWQPTGYQPSWQQSPADARGGGQQQPQPPYPQPPGPGAQTDNRTLIAVGMGVIVLLVILILLVLFA